MASSQGSSEARFSPIGLLSTPDKTDVTRRSRPDTMPSLPKLKLPSLPNPKLGIGSRSPANVIGLDIQPGFVAAVEAKVNGAGSPNALPRCRCRATPFARAR